MHICMSKYVPNSLMKPAHGQHGQQAASPQFDNYNRRFDNMILQPIMMDQNKINAHEARYSQPPYEIVEVLEKIPSTHTYREYTVYWKWDSQRNCYELVYDVGFNQCKNVEPGIDSGKLQWSNQKKN